MLHFISTTSLYAEFTRKSKFVFIFAGTIANITISWDIGRTNFAEKFGSLGNLADVFVNKVRTRCSIGMDIAHIWSNQYGFIATGNKAALGGICYVSVSPKPSEPVMVPTSEPVSLYTSSLFLEESRNVSEIFPICWVGLTLFVVTVPPAMSTRIVLPWGCTPNLQF